MNSFSPPTLRPSHADWTYLEEYGIKASSGGGRSSARKTIVRVAAGAVAEKWLAEQYQVHNDPFFVAPPQVSEAELQTRTNHSGGVRGGLSNGMPLFFRVALKPPATISQDQTTARYDASGEGTLAAKGRHGPARQAAWPGAYYQEVEDNNGRGFTTWPSLRLRERDSQVAEYQ